MSDETYRAANLARNLPPYNGADRGYRRGYEEGIAAGWAAALAEIREQGGVIVYAKDAEIEYGKAYYPPNIMAHPHPERQQKSTTHQRYVYVYRGEWFSIEASEASRV